MHVKVHNLKVTDAEMVVNHGETLYHNINDGIRQYLPMVNAELLTIVGNREADSIRHAQQCLVFAILSPGCRIACNSLLARRFFDAIDAGVRFESCDDLYQEIATGVGGRGIGRNIRSLFMSLETLLNISPDDMTKPVILALRKARRLMGIGEKTAAMAVALFNAQADVFTLDVHMLRWITSTLFDLTAEGHTIDDAAYRMLEPWFVNWCRTYYPAESPFAIQWAIWDVRQGKHETHTPIFGL